MGTQRSASTDDPKEYTSSSPEVATTTMPVTTTTTTRTTTSGVAVHTISFRGLAGAIFVCLAISTVLYVIGFATMDWAIKGEDRIGLWETCRTTTHVQSEDWFHAVQALISIGLVGLVLCIILAIIYLCVHTVSKNSTIIALVIFCFLSVIFMVVGFAIFGVNMEDAVNWSFAITVVASVFCLIAGILAIVQLRKSGVKV